jgi:hypothetical protein
MEINFLHGPEATWTVVEPRASFCEGFPIVYDEKIYSIGTTCGEFLDRKTGKWRKLSLDNAGKKVIAVAKRSQTEFLVVYDIGSVDKFDVEKNELKPVSEVEGVCQPKKTCGDF